MAALGAHWFCGPRVGEAGASSVAAAIRERRGRGGAGDLRGPGLAALEDLGTAWLLRKGPEPGEVSSSDEFPLGRLGLIPNREISGPMTLPRD